MASKPFGLEYLLENVAASEYFLACGQVPCVGTRVFISDFLVHVDELGVGNLPSDAYFLVARANHGMVTRSQARPDPAVTIQLVIREE